MTAAVIAVADLPASPTDAATQFYARYAQAIRAAGPAGAVIVFQPADHSHSSWRLAAVQELAREAAPARVNAIVGDDTAAIAQTLAYLAAAPGVTGQVLGVDAIDAESD